MLIVRIWRSLLMLKRKARGHDTAGISGTKPGELAIQCPACPRPGVNLPESFRSRPVPDRYDERFIYLLRMLLTRLFRWLDRLHVCLDANFRLKNRMRSSYEKDPGLLTGWAYFVDDEKYRVHILNHVDEEEVRPSSSTTFS